MCQKGLQSRRIQRFLVQQGLHAAGHHLAALAQQLRGPLQRGTHYGMHRTVHGLLGGFGNQRACAPVLGQAVHQHGRVRAVVADAPQGFVHAVAHHHVTRQRGGSGQIVGRAGGDGAQHQLLGRTPAQQNADAVFKLLPGHEVTVLQRALDGVAQRANATRDDRHLVDDVAAGQAERDQRVADFVVGHGAAFERIEQAVAFFEPGHDALDGGSKVSQRDLAGLTPRGHDGRFIDQIGQIGPRKPRRQCRHLAQRQVLGQGDAPHMHLQNLHPARTVGFVHQHLPVKPARAQQGRVQNFRAVGGRQNDHARRGVKTVHLGQQLVEGLLLFVVPAPAAQHAARTAQRVQFVNEHDGGRQLARLLEQIAHTRSAHADKEFNKLAARHGKERHTGLTGHRLGQQGLTGARRSDQQHALGDVRA